MLPVRAACVHAQEALTEHIGTANAAVFGMLDSATALGVATGCV